MTLDQRRRPRHRSARDSVLRRVLCSWSASRVIVAVIAALGIAVLLYPSAGAWFAQRSHDDAVGSYSREVGALRPAEVAAQLDQASAYNAHLPTGGISDPYATTGASPAAADYLAVLDGGGTGVMGVLQIPEIDVRLLIYHGTGPSSLDRGVGHLYGTALPVGGRGTHSVLTAHSGIPGDVLFSRLHELTLGDEFTISVLDETLTYRVDQVETVLPTDVERVRPVQGQDYVTLLTCTPIGVNSHRLLVRAVRVETSAVPDGGRLGVVTPTVPPWWAAVAVAGLAGVVALTAPLATSRRGERRRGA